MASSVSRFSAEGRQLRMKEQQLHTSDPPAPTDTGMTVKPERGIRLPAQQPQSDNSDRMRRQVLHPEFSIGRREDDQSETCHPVSSDCRPKRAYMVYDHADDVILNKIAKVISSKRALGLATIFDKQSAESGLTNLNYLVISTQSPAMTYVFDCVTVDPVYVLEAIRGALLCPDIMIVVHDVLSCIGYLYQRHYLELPNVVDLHAVDLTLRKPNEDVVESGMVSLEELIQVYVQPSFVWPKVKEEECQEPNSWTQPKANGLDVEQCDAAMHGAFLLDIAEGQQQRMIGAHIRRLGDKVRRDLAEVF